MDQIHRRTTGVCVLAILLLVGGAGAGSRTDPPHAGALAAVAPAADGAARPADLVIVPGRPGEPATVQPADRVAPTAGPRYNTLDVWYVRMMIPHHTQALRMAALAPDRASDPRVRALAGRIQASQSPEIHQMRAWLDARGLPPEEPGHDHGAMRGMQSPAAMRRLAAATGAEFDRMFVTMMIDHHRGAIEMAVNLLRVGVDVITGEIATAVAAEQGVEIDRMRALFPAAG
ncbi:DUF305 domain-containing protein [Micromonospora polyrhachis]|uniref:Uncharacterized protein (DUF305 family) n=1 Tax=Micromonospora polyrhachis TaxID=1282883 RepID=A0A7W7WT43_9ACTN|nr:DUF305 domain-containing protein [Micromonospora polyrhachis]MBB4962073.1 uncharacterized protein (DUF305 family) [Micromonospora polyrhachis]